MCNVATGRTAWSGRLVNHDYYFHLNRELRRRNSVRKPIHVLSFNWFWKSNFTDCIPSLYSSKQPKSTKFVNSLYHSKERHFRILAIWRFHFFSGPNLFALWTEVWQNPNCLVPNFLERRESLFQTIYRCDPHKKLIFIKYFLNHILKEKKIINYFYENMFTNWMITTIKKRKIRIIVTSTPNLCVNVFLSNTSLSVANWYIFSIPFEIEKIDDPNIIVPYNHTYVITSFIKFKWLDNIFTILQYIHRINM